MVHFNPLSAEHVFCTFYIFCIVESETLSQFYLLDKIAR